MKDKKTIIICLALLGCIAAAVTDGIIKPPYAVKSLIKIIFFTAIPLFYSYIYKDSSVRELFALSKKGLLSSLLLGLIVYAAVMAFFIFSRNILDFSDVASGLSQHENIDAGNFIYAALYVSLVNSLLEEFFFRGFAFLVLSKSAGRTAAYLFSSALFSLYHITMILKVVSPFMTVLGTAGLFLGGLIFNFLNERNGSVYSSWMVHMFADFAVVTIGLILLKMI